MRNEWIRTLKTPVQVVMMLIVPFLAIMFTIWGLCYVTANAAKYKAEVVCRNEEELQAAKDLTDAYPDISPVLGGNFEERISQGKIDAAVVILDDHLEIVYDSTIITSSQAIKDCSDLSFELVFRLEGKQLYDDMKEFMPEKQIIDLSSDEDKLDHNIQQFGGVIGMLIFLLMSSNAMSLSSRSITGEKERKTFDTLVLCPTRLSDILMGKTLVIMSQILLSGLVAVGSAILAENIWNQKAWSTVVKVTKGNLSWLLAVLILIVTVMMVMTAIYTLIASAFAEAKKSSLFSSAGMAVISFAAVVPTFVDAKWTSYVPVINWTPMILSICKNKTDFVPLLISFCIGLIMFLLSIAFSSALWERNAE